MLRGAGETWHAPRRRPQQRSKCGGSSRRSTLSEGVYTQPPSLNRLAVGCCPFSRVGGVNTARATPASCVPRTRAPRAAPPHARRSLRVMAALTSTSSPPPTHSTTRSKASAARDRLKESEELALQRALERQQSEATESPDVRFIENQEHSPPATPHGDLGTCCPRGMCAKVLYVRARRPLSVSARFVCVCV